MGEFKSFMQKVYHTCTSEALETIIVEGMTAGSFQIGR